MQRRRPRDPLAVRGTGLQQLPGRVQLLDQQVAQAGPDLGRATAHRLRGGEDRDRTRPTLRRTRTRRRQRYGLAPVPGGPPAEELAQQGIGRQRPDLLHRARRENRPGQPGQPAERSRVQPPGPGPRLHPPGQPGERGMPLRAHPFPHRIRVADRAQRERGRLAQLRPPGHRVRRIQRAGGHRDQIHRQSAGAEPQPGHPRPRHLAQPPRLGQRRRHPVPYERHIGRAARQRRHQVQIGLRQRAADTARPGRMHPPVAKGGPEARGDRLGYPVPGRGRGPLHDLRLPAHLARPQRHRRPDPHRPVPAPREHGQLPYPRGHRATEPRREGRDRSLRVLAAPQRQMRGVAALFARPPPAAREPLRQRAPELLPGRLTGRRRIQPHGGVLTVPEAVHPLQPGGERHGRDGHLRQQRQRLGEGGLRHEAEEQVHVLGPAPGLRVERAAQLPYRLRQGGRQPGHRRPRRRRDVEASGCVARLPELHRRLHTEVVGDEQPFRGG